MERGEGKSHGAKTFLRLGCITSSVLQCKRDEHDAGSIPDEVSNVRFGMVQIAATVQGGIADQKQAANVVMDDEHHFLRVLGGYQSRNARFHSSAQRRI